MCTTVAIALTSLVVALIVISSNTYRHHQNAKSVTKENDASDSFWDSSHLSLEERDELTKTVTAMAELGGDLILTPHIERYNTSVWLPSSSREGWEDDNNQDVKIGRRRRLREVTTAQHSRGSSPPPEVEDKWEAEAGDMKDEFMQYFLEQDKGNEKSGQTDNIGWTSKSQLKDTKRTEVKRSTNYDHNSFQMPLDRMVQSKPSSPKCIPGERIACPPEDLPQKCDKYNEGKFSSCFDACKKSYCCAHDSKSNLFRSCSQETSCRYYAPCYIIWWKMQDTIGPGFIRIIQEDDFFDTAYDEIKDTRLDDDSQPFPLLALRYHLFDDDYYKAEDIFLNSSYW